jgi:ADP-ribose pyrophosphatase
MKVKTVYKNKWLSVTNDKNFYTVDENTDQVTILPIIDRNKLLLVKQYRHAIKKYTLEFPSGGIDKNETPKSGAVRELFEETGITIINHKKLIELPTISVNPQRNRKYPKIYYFNTSKKEIPKKINEKNKEIDKLYIVDFKSFLNLCEKRLIISSFMISVFFLYLLKKKIKLKYEKN